MANYPQDLILRLEAEYPEQVDELRAKLAAGDLDGCNTILKPALMSLNVNEFLGAIDSGTLAGLEEKCRTYRRRLELYYEWSLYAFGSFSVERQKTA